MIATRKFGMSPERGFATNILYGPAAVDPKLRAELNEKYRKNTDGPRDRMNLIRKDLSAFDDAAAVAAGIDDLNAKFVALRDAMAAEILGRVEAPQSQFLRDVAQPLALRVGELWMTAARKLRFQIMRLERNQFAVDEFRDRLADHGSFVIGAHLQAFQSAKPT